MPTRMFSSNSESETISKISLDTILKQYKSTIIFKSIFSSYSTSEITALHRLAKCSEDDHLSQEDIVKCIHSSKTAESISRAQKIEDGTFQNILSTGTDKVLMNIQNELVKYSSIVFQAT